MNERNGFFQGDDPFLIAKTWLEDARAQEANDPDAAALATTGKDGLPNVRMVLMREIESNAFIFYTNYGSIKAREISENPKVAFVLHWKSLRRQIRVRGEAEKEEGVKADSYFSSRSLKSRLGAWASHQSAPLESRKSLMLKVSQMTLKHGVAPTRPPFWGGFRVFPLEIEFWADGAYRLHDRFRWSRKDRFAPWSVLRLNP